MEHKFIRFCVAVAAFGLVIVGCSKEPEAPTVQPPAPPAQPAPAAQADTTTVKPMDEYRSDADKQITPANAEAELSKIEKEIAADK